MKGGGGKNHYLLLARFLLEVGDVGWVGVLLRAGRGLVLLVGVTSSLDTCGWFQRH